MMHSHTALHTHLHGFFTGAGTPAHPMFSGHPLQHLHASKRRNFEQPGLGTPDHLSQTPSDPFLARFGRRLPAGLREEAAGMTWRQFTQTYAPDASLRLRLNEGTKVPGFHHRYTATLTAAHGGMVHTEEITATGPAQAATQLLARAGRRVEMLSFHQFDIFESTVTFLLAGNDRHQHWVMGFGGSREQSVAAALSAAGERLYGARQLAAQPC